ncbi:MAG: OmpH family outer membrane protein [Candidatus Zixiibacteriota bacterium]
MRKLLSVTLTVVAASFILAAAAAQAQGFKVAVVRDEVIKQQYKAFQKAQEQWELEKRGWDSTAADLQQAVQDLQVDYDKQKLILSDEKKREREKGIRDKQAQLDGFTSQVYGPDGLAQHKQEELLNPILDNINKALETIANEDGYDMIFTSGSALGYFRPTLDITEKVLAYLAKLEK